jgi:hypothetical protein
LSNAARSYLLDAAAHFKLAQLDSMYELSCAIDNGEELPVSTNAEAVTRPVALMRGQLHIAHDAGHHATPAVAHVADDQRWTAADHRANAAFRATSDESVYLAPPVNQLGYLPFAFGAPATVATPPIEPHASVGPLLSDALKKIIDHALYYLDVSTDAVLEEAFGAPVGTAGNAVDRRSGIYNEFLRDAAISTDRVWSFIQTVSGLIGEDATALIVTTEEKTSSNAKELEQQRRATAERVAAFQAKLVETLVAGMLKESGLRLDTASKDPAATAAGALVIMNADTAKQMNDLAAGESGRPFFEANVALRNLCDRNQGAPQKLADVVAQIGGIAQTLQTALDAGASGVGATGGPSLAELSLPRNCLFVKLREDTTAAIRSAFDKLTVESALAGMRKISLYELVEGADHTLTTRWAEFVGHVLVQNRTSTGVSALYASRAQLTVNATQAMVSLRRLMHHAQGYALGAAPVFPEFPEHDTGTVPGNQAARNTALANARKAYFDAHRTSAGASWAQGASLQGIMAAQLRWQRVARDIPNTAPVTWQLGMYG